MTCRITVWITLVTTLIARHLEGSHAFTAACSARPSTVTIGSRLPFRKSHLTGLSVSAVPRGSNRRESRQDDYDEDEWLTPYSERDDSSDQLATSRNQPHSRSSSSDDSRYPKRSGAGRSHLPRPRKEDRKRQSKPSPSSPREQLVEIDITDTNAHFFSKKPLNDPSLKMADHELFLPLCQGAGITRPSRIQSLAWPQILSGKPTLVADQTGSGKTLAYLLPLLQRALSTPTKTKTSGTPKILILAPTAELADQIRDVCQKISMTVPFSTMVVTASGKFETSIRDQIRRIQRTPIDVLISTPGRISTILRTRNSGLDLKSQLQAVVLDEVDILLVDETFGPQLRTVSEAVPNLEQTQFVFVTATLPDQIVRTVQQEFPSVVQVRGPGLHRVAPSLKERLVDVSVPAQNNRDPEMCFDIKAKQLLQALRQNRCRRTLIFCNTVESCRDVENLLKRRDRKGNVYHVGAYHNAMTPENRNANLELFAKGSQDGQLLGGAGATEEKVDYVLICTDRAARGVDFDASPVDHVVIFDFPKDPAEYVRRVGRTARAGRSGTCTVFAYGWQLPIARQVMGKKLDSFTIAATTELGEKESNEELYSFRKNRRTTKTKDEMIKATIESGQLWDQ